MWVAFWSIAKREVIKVLLVYGFQYHRCRTLNDFVLDHEFANRTLTAVVFIEPDPFDRGGTVVSRVESLVEVAQVIVQVFGVFLHRHVVNSRRGVRVYP